MVFYSIKVLIGSHTDILFGKNQILFSVFCQTDLAWLSDLAFLVDISKHMIVFNIKLQGRDHLINKLFEHMSAHLRWSFVYEWEAIMHIFQRCVQVKLMRPQHLAFVGQLWEQFKTQFADQHANNQAFALFAAVFTINMDSVVVHLQMELIDLKCSPDLKTKFTDSLPSLR